MAFSAVILGVSMHGAQARGEAQDAQSLFARAVELHQKGDLEGAIRNYLSFLEIHPEQPAVRSNLGAAYARLGRYTEAIEQYQRALRFDANNMSIRFNLGVAHFKAMQIPEATAELAKVVVAQPENLNAVYVLADCHLRVGENKKVIELLSPLVTAHQDDRTILYALGTALIRDQQIEKGSQLVDRILRDGDSAEARVMLGSAHMMRKDYAGALSEFESALKLDANLPGVYSLYGTALMNTGEYDRAKEAFRRELERSPADSAANFNLGIILNKEREFDQALPYLQKALQLKPGDAAVRYQIGSLHVAGRNWTEAQRVLEELVKDEPDFVEAHVSLATVYYRLNRKADGDRERAIIQKLNAENQARAAGEGDQQSQVRHAKTQPDAIDKGQLPQTQAELSAEVSALTPSPSSTRASSEEGAGKAPNGFDDLAKRADQAREAERTAEAIELYQAALKIRPSWKEGWWYLGLVRYAADLYADALDAFRRQVALDPEAGGAAWALLGLCEFQTREYERALEHLQRGRRLGLGADKELSRVVRYRTALLLTRMEQFEAATQILNPLVVESGDHPTLVEALGLSTLALSYLPTELPPDKRDLVVKAGKAAVYGATHRLDDAEREYKELLARYPKAPGTHYSYGVFLLRENPDAALEEFKRELEILPSSDRALLQISFEYINRNMHAAGLPFAEKAVRLKPKEFAARNALGRILLETGDVKGAIRELEEGVRLAPDSPEMRYVLARAYTRDGRKDDAAREHAEFVRLDKLRRELKGEPLGLPAEAADRRPPI
jgi:tetratricopeptide (TPR) repeat protein